MNIVFVFGNNYISYNDEGVIVIFGKALVRALVEFVIRMNLVLSTSETFV